MPGGVDIRNLLSSIINAVKSRANQICASTCDGLVLRMHYRWTFWLLLGGFFTTWYSWYHRDVITCVSHFNAETQVRLDYINICLSYPYLQEEDGRRYLLFYRWISWSFLLLAGVFYIPRKISKNFDNPKCKKVLEELAANSHLYDATESKLVERVWRYLCFNLRTHDGLYWKYLTVNVVALFVDLACLHFLDFVLQGRFLRYGFKAYPFERDPQNFSDYMSQTFPPFASCEIDAEKQLVNKRTELFGCHLTIMELYEKLFLVLWAWLIFLTTITACYLVFLTLFWIPYFRWFLLRTSRPVHGKNKLLKVLSGVSRNCRVGDVYLLYRVKGHMSHARFYELLVLLADPNVYTRQQERQEQQSTPQQPQSKIDAPKTKQRDVTIDPSMNPEYLYRLLGSPELLGNTTHRSNKPNTSLLIDD